MVSAKASSWAPFSVSMAVSHEVVKFMTCGLHLADILSYHIAHSTISFVVSSSIRSLVCIGIVSVRVNSSNNADCHRCHSWPGPGCLLSSKMYRGS